MSDAEVKETATYILFPEYPFLYLMKEFRGRTMTKENWTEVIQALKTGGTYKLTNCISKAGKEYTTLITGISKDGKELITELAPLHPLEIKCPKSGRPVDDAGKFFAFPGFPRLYCAKELFGRKMSVEDFVAILTRPGEPVQFGEFISKKGKPYTAKLRYNAETNRIDLVFDDNKSTGNKPYKSKTFSDSKEQDVEDDIPGF
mgnify:CR=1 FL=1